MCKRTLPPDSDLREQARQLRRDLMLAGYDRAGDIVLEAMIDAGLATRWQPPARRRSVRVRGCGCDVTVDCR